jgi:hypothetical protein
MTAAQIAWQVVIGLFLLVVGMALQPLFKRAWGWLNRPTPLSPGDKGKLVEQIALVESELERLNHFAPGRYRHKTKP